jgi:hypothetical protein
VPDAAAPLTTRFTRRQRLPLLLLSCAVVTPLVALLLGGGLAMLALKTALMLGANAAHAALGLSPQAAVTLGSAIGGALLAVFTELTNLPLQALARRLTALENHRTQTAHDDALTLKVSLFLLTNSYAPLLYVAFVKATGRVHSPLSGALEYCHDRAHFASSLAEITAAHGGGNPFCMHEMHTLLMSLVLTSQLTGQLKVS